ncbi:MAG: Uma2 family endonuclease [Dysgonamonadaceae bacterium]|jgi:Uma2 family endonuclease|nr:Uma2 family endonuclease [Dysgonamonadaceae bacterium]
MGKETKPLKEYEYPEPEEENINKVEDPATAYGLQRYSYADYLSWTDDVMRELLNGIVYTFAAPFRNHAKVISTLMIKADAFITRRKGKCEIYTASFDVRLPLNGSTEDNKIYNVVQPDICVVCDPSKLDKRGCIGAPDLIVEVISPSTAKKDLNEKHNLYEAAGVYEYWVVYPKDKAVTVFLLQEDRQFDTGTTYQIIDKKVRVPVHTLEGLIINLDELFE